VLAQVCYAVAVNAAEDWPWTALAPIVLGRRFVDQVRGVKALAIVTKVTYVTIRV